MATQTSNITMKQAIENIALEAMEDMVLESMNGCIITPHIFNSTIELTIDMNGITFENHIAKGGFKYGVSHYIWTKFPEFYQRVFPPIVYR